MKLDRHWLIGLMIVALCGFFKCTVAFAYVPPTDQITIGLDANYAPLQSVDKEGIPHGYDIDFTRELMNRMGIKFYYIPNLWNKVATSVLNGDTDLAMMVYSPYRKDSIHYSRPIFRLYYQVVYRKNEYKTFDFRNLKGKTFAFLDSRHISKLVDHDGGKSVKVNDLDQAFRELSSGRFDAIICYRYQAKYFIDHYHLDNLTREDISLQPREYCYVGHNKELIDAISLEIAKMDSEGLVDKIYGTDIKDGAYKRSTILWIVYPLFILVLILVVLLILLLLRSRTKLNQNIAMLKSNHKILETSHLELEQTNQHLSETISRSEELLKQKNELIKQIARDMRIPLNKLSDCAQIISIPNAILSNEESDKLKQDMTSSINELTNLSDKLQKNC